MFKSSRQTGKSFDLLFRENCDSYAVVLVITSNTCLPLTTTRANKLLHICCLRDAIYLWCYPKNSPFTNDLESLAFLFFTFRSESFRLFINQKLDMKTFPRRNLVHHLFLSGWWLWYDLFSATIERTKTTTLGDALCAFCKQYPAYELSEMCKKKLCIV